MKVRAPASRNGIVLAAALVLTGALAPGLGRAQIDNRSNAPIDITADEAEVITSKCVAIWRGAAEALQGKTRLRASTITVYSVQKGPPAGGCGGTDRLEAEGQVFYVTPTQSVRGDRAVYSASADQIVITGNVIVVQGDDVVRGDRLTLKISTRQAHLESNVKGPGKGARVRGVFYPGANGQVGMSSIQP